MAIVSDKPQTTRRAIRGIATGDDWQLVLVDLPGVQRPRDPLTERMQRRVERELARLRRRAVRAERRAGDRRRATASSPHAIRNAGLPAVTALNKVDLLDRAAHGRGARRRRPTLDVPGEIYPGQRARRAPASTELVERARRAACPRARSSTRPRSTTDLPLEVRLAELIREQVLLRTREELPHAVEVEVDEIEEREDGLLVVARPRVGGDRVAEGRSWSARAGSMVRAIGTAARKEIETLLGRRVHLDLSVRVRKGWRARRGPARPARHRVSATASSTDPRVSCAAPRRPSATRWCRPRTARRCSRRACRSSGS